MADVTNSAKESDAKEKRQFWEGHIQAWQQSGLTQAEYCRKNNLKNHRWWYWRKRISHPPEREDNPLLKTINLLFFTIQGGQAHRRRINLVNKVSFGLRF